MTDIGIQNYSTEDLVRELSRRAQSGEHRYYAPIRVFSGADQELAVLSVYDSVDLGRRYLAIDVKDD